MFIDLFSRKQVVVSFLLNLINIITDDEGNYYDVLISKFAAKMNPFVYLYGCHYDIHMISILRELPNIFMILWVCGSSVTVGSTNPNCLFNQIKWVGFNLDFTLLIQIISQQHAIHVFFGWS